MAKKQPKKAAKKSRPKKQKPIDPKQRAVEYQSLIAIPGIGAATANKLLGAFQTMAKIRKQYVPGLSKVLGKSTANRVFVLLHGDDAPKQPHTRESKRGRKNTYSDVLADSIAADYAEGTGTIKEVMEKHGFSERTFYHWQQEYLHFFQAIKTATEMRNNRKREMALVGMQRLLSGYEFTERSVESRPVRDKKTGEEMRQIKKTTVTSKFIAPNPTMIIFTLCNLDPETFKSIQHIRYDGTPPPAPYNFDDFDSDELKEFERLAEKASKNNGRG